MQVDNKVELLSPARDCNVARTAILAGADAVYIGASQFGARSAAANQESDIAELCSFAHLWGAKVYVALNTILNDAELESAARMTYRLKDAGVDALIVQDMGLLKCDIANIALHASTQCNIASVEKAKLMDALGFETIVLARELSLEEISAIKNQVNARIECFVHGALCVSYSGCCYLSQAIGGRSGNRGECAQPCRMKYALLDADMQQVSPPAHYLSLRDMNRSKSLAQMLDVGVRSFKIEGRLKDESYVKNITAFYRRELDKLLSTRGLERQSFGESFVKFIPEPKKTFNRGFTEYHLHGTQSSCESFATPKSRGELLGIVEKTFRNGFFFRDAWRVFSNADGLFFEGAHDSIGASVSGVDGDRVWVGQPSDDIYIEQNSKLWRNFDAKFERELKPEPTRKMKVSCTLGEDENSWIFTMKLCDARALAERRQLLKSDFQQAQNRDIAADKIAESLGKLGATNFECVSGRAKILSQSVPYLKASAVNEIRRGLAEGLESAILKQDCAVRDSRSKREILPSNFDTSLASGLPQDYNANVLNKKAQLFYKLMGVEVGEYSPENGRVDLHGKRVMTTKHCILRELGMCKRKNPQTLKEPLYLQNEETTLKLSFDCARCGMEIFFQ